MTNETKQTNGERRKTIIKPGLIEIFKEISKKDVSTAGGKGASLGEMIQAGIPVPEGFVILSNSFEEFIKVNDLNIEIDAVLDKVNIEEVHTIEDASEQIKSLILSAKIPKDIEKEILLYFKRLDYKFVAVRSSATSEDSASAAWAGQLETYLNTTEKDLLDNVKKCWASLFTPRAIFYRLEQKLDKKKISVAVVVQKMIESEESGIAFSVHPVTQNRNQLIIEAGYGLGEAIVSGQITPNSYVVEKSTNRILNIKVNRQDKALFKKENGGNEWKKLGKKGEKQVLNDEEIKELAKLIAKIENQYGFPVDVEWAKENGKFYILQSRPITTLRVKEQTIKNKVTELNWKKFYEGRYSFLVCFLGLDCYFETFQNEIGVCFDHAFVAYEKGITTCYLVQEDIDKIITFLIHKIQKDDTLINVWADRLKKATDVANEFFAKDPKELLKPDFFKDFKEAVYVFSVYKFINTEIGNHMDKKLLNTYFSKMEGARKYSEKFYFNLTKSCETILKEIKKKEDYPVNLLECLTLEELESYLIRARSLPNKEILEKRYIYSGILYSPSPILLNEEETKEILGSIINYSDSQEIKGVIGYPGKVRGVCRLIKDFRNANMANGEILVTGMTDPNYVPLMKKAAAIVTDAGGILCHAAIVSRELKKPCIIGTHIATQALKNGDEVEVDADNGIIRIVKRFKEDSS